MGDLRGIFDGATAIYKGTDKVVRVEHNLEVLYDEWPNCTISVDIDEHAHGVEPAEVPYGQPYQSGELTVDDGYCIKSVEVIME